MYTFFLVVDVVASISLVALVLLQQGKGADAGAAFGSGASGTVFGSRGSANFLTRATAVCALVFFSSSLALAYLVQNQRTKSDSVIETMGTDGTEATEEALGGLLPGSIEPAEDEDGIETAEPESVEDETPVIPE